MQPMMNRSSVFEDPDRTDPPDVFCNLGCLIVEGRVPSPDDRGYCEGPHAPPPRAVPNPRHDCIDDNFMCKQDKSFRKHLLLLWQNSVPLSIEVLLCSDCRSGDRKSPFLEFSSIPEPAAILLEQWTISIHAKSSSETLISSRGLFQAVRSYLHFSQLSAWYSSSKGLEPKNVLYRITIPGENFSTKFSHAPIEHFFPPASVSQSSCICVSVRSQPRSVEIPRVDCTHLKVDSDPLQQVHESEICQSLEEDRKLPMAGALSWKQTGTETDLRKAIVKSKLADCISELYRSDSSDSILSDSLLDPPQSLKKIPPRRYQSPSRCGSPSHEAPEHLLFRNAKTAGAKADDDFDASIGRRARQDLLRRRDLNHGLHPRLLDHQLKVKPSSLKKADDHPVRVHSPRQIEENEIEISLEEPKQILESSIEVHHLGAKMKHRRDSKALQDLEGEEVGDIDDQVVEYAANGEDRYQQEMQELIASLSPKGSACSSRRSSVKEDENLFCNPPGMKLKGKQVGDIFNDGGNNRSRFHHQSSQVTQVYRAEVSPPESELHAQNNCKSQETFSQNSRLSQQKLGFCTLKYDPRWSTEEGRKVVDSEYSSSREPRWLIDTDSSTFLAPLDISFDEEKMTEEEFLKWRPFDATSSQSMKAEAVKNGNASSSLVNTTTVSHGIAINMVTNNNVPSYDAVNTFLKSFDSATSMVFHGRTGLPLTSSPAPLRRSRGNFDFDVSIHSPHDIKRALFPDDNIDKQEEQRMAVQRRRRHSQKLLSASAPANISSTNLLCNFEESVLNGRLEPVSTVEGFTAEIGASGSFHPKHSILPVTVFFYTLCDNATVSSPYLGHINLGKKGYRVPPKGTIQVTLFNPLGTVVKMFVVMYNLSDMPPNSQTFLRQRTLYMPSDLTEASNENAQKWLRYLIHLRFASSKSGKIYLHTDVRMIIFRKSDLDTATDHSPGKGFELRSFTRGPSNPKFSPRR